jgi:hypothetical protein
MQSSALEVVKTSGSTAALSPIWAEAVGSQIAKNATVKAWYGDALLIEVSSKPWLEAIAAQQAQIVARLHEHLGVRSLRLVLKGSSGAEGAPR